MKSRIPNLQWLEELDKCVVYRAFQAMGYRLLGLEPNGEPKKA